MALNWISLMTIASSIAGIVFFIYSYIIIIKIKTIFPSGKVRKKWSIIQILISIFLIGYIANIIFNITENVELILIMTAIVYIFGGLFVFIIINLSYKTYRLIVSKE